MAEQTIRDFHAHIYFDADQIDRAQRLAKAAHERFVCPSVVSTAIRSGRIREEAVS